MSILTKQMSGYLERSSWIRKMFEAGTALKAQYGEEAVCDFSLGNPDLPPPASVAKGLHELADEADSPFALGYMPNGGYPAVRQALAGRFTKEQGLKLDASDIILTCGAAGGLNCLFKAILEPGDEVLAPSPYFVEYGFYVQNHQGAFKAVPSKPDSFELDIPGFEAAIGPKTRAVLINSPNNPTGQVYSREELRELCDLLDKKSVEHGRPILLISDEPYRFLAFDGVEVPSILPLYPFSVAVSSFSKNLSLAGERVGYVILAPDMPDKAELMNGLTLANRILGFVNPPAVGQKLVLAALDDNVDASIYAARRKAMAEVLDEAGYDYFMPRGAFYFFPKAPGGDDVAFCQRLAGEKVLAVPGSGFGMPGYFRLTFCVDEAVIRRSVEGFKRAKS